MQAPIPSDVIIQAIDSLVGCRSCLVAISGSATVRISTDAEPISIQPVSKANFAGNGIPYLQALMKYPAIWKIDSVSAWETLENGKGFVSNNRIAAIGLYSLTTASRTIRVSVCQPDGRCFVVEKNESGEFASSLKEGLTPTNDSTTTVIESVLNPTSFALYPNDFLRLASRLRDLAYRKQLKATLSDERPESSLRGMVYYF